MSSGGSAFLQPSSSNGLASKALNSNTPNNSTVPAPSTTTTTAPVNRSFHSVNINQAFKSNLNKSTLPSQNKSRQGNVKNSTLLSSVPLMAPKPINLPSIKKEQGSMEMTWRACSSIPSVGSSPSLYSLNPTSSSSTSVVAAGSSSALGISLSQPSLAISKDELGSKEESESKILVKDTASKRDSVANNLSTSFPKVSSLASTNHLSLEQMILPWLDSDNASSSTWLEEDNQIDFSSEPIFEDELVQLPAPSSSPPLISAQSPSPSVSTTTTTIEPQQIPSELLSEVELSVHYDKPSSYTYGKIKILSHSTPTNEEAPQDPIKSPTEASNPASSIASEVEVPPKPISEESQAQLFKEESAPCRSSDLVARSEPVAQPTPAVDSEFKNKSKNITLEKASAMNHSHYSNNNNAEHSRHYHFNNPHSEYNSNLYPSHFKSNISKNHSNYKNFAVNDNDGDDDNWRKSLQHSIIIPPPFKSTHKKSCGKSLRPSSDGRHLMTGPVNSNLVKPSSIDYKKAPQPSNSQSKNPIKKDTIEVQPSQTHSQGQQKIIGISLNDLKKLKTHLSHSSPSVVFDDGGNEGVLQNQKPLQAPNSVPHSHNRKSTSTISNSKTPTQQLFERQELYSFIQNVPSIIKIPLATLYKTKEYLNSL